MIRDFTSRHGDLIVLDKIDANPALAGDQAFVWKADDPLTGIGQLHYRHLGGGDTIVEGNLSGSTAPELQILLHGHLTVFAVISCCSSRVGSSPKPRMTRHARAGIWEMSVQWGAR